MRFLGYEDLTWGSILIQIYKKKRLLGATAL